MWGLWYISIAGLTLPCLALHFSCVKHSVNAGRAERASRLRKCHHLQQENTSFCWQRALPSVPAQRPCTVYQRQLWLGSKVALFQPSSVSSQWLYPLWVSGSPWRKEASLQTMEGGEASIESAAPDLPHSAAQVRVLRLFFSTDSFQQIWFPR